MRFALTVGMAWVLGACMAFAGIPVSEDETCPIGGERFSITSTLSCSYGPFGITMSGRRLSSCDFVTRLPECPTNKLPLYKQFTVEDLAAIEPFITSVEYVALYQRSRYYRAFQIEQRLGGDASTLFSILLAGLQNDPGASFTDDVYMATFFQAYERARVGFNEDAAKPFALMTAYAYARRGHADEALALIAKIKPIGNKGPLVDYAAAIESCVRTWNEQSCQPDAVIVSSQARR